MSWTLRLLLLMSGAFLVAALAADSPPEASPPPRETFKDDWPAPDEESIEYLKGVDLRTLQTRDPNQLFAERVDLLGDPLPPGATVRLVSSRGVLRLAVSPDGKRIASSGPGCSERSVDIHDASTGRCERRLGAFGAIVEALAISADGRRLAVARGDFSGFKDLAGHITVYDLHSFEELCKLGEGTGPRALAFLPDGRLISGGGDGVVWLWDVETGEVVRSIADLTRKVSALALSPDGKVLATSSTDEVIRLWDVASGTPIQQIDAEPASMLAYAVDGRHLASNYGVWELASGQRLPRLFGKETRALAFSPDGRTVATYDEKQICLRELSTGQIRRLIRWEDQYAHYRNVIAFSPDGRSVITGENYGEGLIWDVTGLRWPPPPVRAVDLEAMLYSLSDGQAGPAYTAMWGLVAAGKESAPLLAERLKQPPPVVEPRRLAKLVAELDNADFHVRDRATLELENLGREAVKPLRGLLADGPPLEVRVRAEQILARIANRGGRLPHELFRLRAVEALENIGSREAVQALEGLTQSSDAELREDVQRTLVRLKNRERR